MISKEVQQIKACDNSIRQTESDSEKNAVDTTIQ